jgi:hypothetical protein
MTEMSTFLTHNQLLQLTDSVARFLTAKSPMRMSNIAQNRNYHLYVQKYDKK